MQNNRVMQELFELTGPKWCSILHWKGQGSVPDVNVIMRQILQFLRYIGPSFGGDIQGVPETNRQAPA